MKLFHVFVLLISFITVNAQPAYLAAVMKDGKWGYIDPQGNWVIQAKFDAALPFSEGLAAVNIGYVGGMDESKMSTGKWGYIDAKGNWMIEPQFEDARSFSEGLACVNQGARIVSWDAPTVIDGKWGFIDKKGNWVIQPQANIQYNNFSEGLARYRRTDKNQFGFIDEKGKVVLDEIMESSDFSHGYSLLLSEIYVDKKGKHAMTFTEATDFVQGMACVRKDESYFMINTKGKKLFDLPGRGIIGDSLVMAETFKDEKISWGYMNLQGRWIIEPKYLWASPFSEGMALVKESETSPYKCIDKKGATLYTLQLADEAKVHFRGIRAGLLLQSYGSGKGAFTFINIDGKPVGEAYDAAHHFTRVN